MQEDILDAVAKSIFKIVANTVRGDVKIEISDEDIIIKIARASVTFVYVLQDVYWSAYYGTSADTLAKVVLRKYSDFINHKFFK